MFDVHPPRVDLGRLTESLRQAVEMPITSEVNELGRNRLVEQARLPSLKAVRPTRRTQWAIGALMAAATVAIWFTVHSRPLTYEIKGGYRSESGYLSVSPNGTAAVEFSDGSSINAAAGTRLRVEDARRDGARVVIERGVFSAHIRHQHDTSWQFIAGPLDVRVVGTAFTLSWDPAREEMNLTLQEGAVEVKSPLGRGPFFVRKGQHFQALLPSHSITLSDSADTPNAITPANAATATVSEPTATAVEQMTPEETFVEPESTPMLQGQRTKQALPHEAPNASDSASKSAPSAPETWTSLASRGRFQDVVAAAETKGIDASLHAGSVGDIRALADAARYTGRSDLAEKSLQTLRQRATGSQRSAAAFLLGRLYESRGQPATAKNWYEAYLREAPSGEYAADALAGAMLATARTIGNASAQPLAMQYLQRYPNGVHAAAAKKIANGQ